MCGSGADLASSLLDIRFQRLHAAGWPTASTSVRPLPLSAAEARSGQPSTSSHTRCSFLMASSCARATPCVTHRRIISRSRPACQLPQPARARTPAARACCASARYLPDATPRPYTPIGPGAGASSRSGSAGAAASAACACSARRRAPLQSCAAATSTAGCACGAACQTRVAHGAPSCHAGAAAAWRQRRSAALAARMRAACVCSHARAAEAKVADRWTEGLTMGRARAARDESVRGGDARRQRRQPRSVHHGAQEARPRRQSAKQ
jgi:hypothetical protein